ncbi:MAG: DUF190 domain-containing protein [Candidatus Heimdallarchaeota archaeon]|nr:DUF190 domain-containing protein [Candidatus Heimdallarchaeota archaeon]
MKTRKMLKVEIRIPGNAKHKGKSLSSEIIQLSKNNGILGATMIQAMLGYGEKEYKPNILRGLPDLPKLIELVDDPQLIRLFLPKLKDMVGEKGLITITEVYAID